MPRVYVRKTNRGSYSEENLQKAIAAVNSGQPLLTTAKVYGIPARTLRRHRDKKVQNPGSINLGRFKPVINKEYEAELVAQIQSMEKLLCGLTTKDVRRIAFDFAVQMNISHRFNTQSKMAGLDWLSGFLLRHPELSIRKPEATNVARVIGFNKSNVEKFFEVYSNVLTDHEYTPMQVWNMDETGISNVHKPGNVIATKGARSVGKITSGEKGKTVTVVCATNAAGNYIPPMMIFPRKRMVDSLMHNAPAGAVGLCTTKGWKDEDCFVKWLQHFTSIAKPSQDKKHIIILDGHHSHKTLQAVQFSRANGIELLTLPPKCTHKMQPLDVSFFKPFKAAYNSACDTWMVANRGKKISFYDMAGILSVAYYKVATVEKSVNGFRKCGLWPFNNCIFSDEDFVDVSAGKVTNSCYQPASSQQPEENQQPVSFQQSDKDKQCQTSPYMAPVNQSTSALQQLDEAQPNLTLPQDEPSTSTANNSATEAKRILFQLCSPSQDKNTRAKARPERKSRVTMQAQHLTSSPYQKLLKEKNQRKNVSNVKKKIVLNKKAIGKKLCKKACNDADSSDDEAWPCLVCGEPYANSRPREKWVQCMICNHWAHEECTPGNLLYVCQNCNSDDDCNYFQPTNT